MNSSLISIDQRLLLSTNQRKGFPYYAFPPVKFLSLRILLKPYFLLHQINQNKLVKLILFFSSSLYFFFWLEHLSFFLLLFFWFEFFVDYFLSFEFRVSWNFLGVYQVLGLFFWLILNLILNLRNDWLEFFLVLLSHFRACIDSHRLQFFFNLSF